MKEQSRGTQRVINNRLTFSDGFLALAAAVFLLAPAMVESGPAGPYKPSNSVKFEDIPNTKLKRVILTERAAQRLGIETGKVGEAQIIRKQIVGGRVVPPVESQPVVNLGRGGFGSFGRVAAQRQESVAASNPSSSSGESWVLVTLSKGEWARLRKDVLARILPLASRDKSGKAVLAQPSGIPPLEDLKRTMLKLYYKLPGKDHGLEMYHRVRVELQLEGTKEKQMVVPYSSVYYDGKGKPWVYIVSNPLTYERKPIAIKRIEGDLAVLTDGPPIGTPVVTVGSALLFGAEVIYKR
ncbi:MAG: hypothetical protein NPINA01_08010 [Nitrospinaceae bacterium]|nr:MAG: hypothetical protein NPINA01_08010 [Nitrospinaceae bacterium]